MAMTKFNVCALDPKRMETSSERRRRLNRERMARTRAEKRVTITALERQEQRLARQLQRLLQQCPSYEKLTERLEGAAATRNTRARMHQCVLQCMRVLQLQSLLMRENASMAQRLDDLRYLHGAVQHVVAHWPSDLVPNTAGPTQYQLTCCHGDVDGASAGYWTSLWEGSTPFYFKRITNAEAEEMVRHTYQKVLALESEFRAEMQQMDVANLECMSWTISLGSACVSAACQEQRRGLRYSLKKRIEIHNLTLDTIADRLQEMLTTPDIHKRTYRVPMKSKLMQRLNDFTTVVLRSMVIDTRPLGGRMLGMNSRLEDRNGCKDHHPNGRRIIHMYSTMDPDKYIVDPELDVVWFRQLLQNIIITYANPQETAVYLESFVHVDKTLSLKEGKAMVLRSLGGMINVAAYICNRPDLNSAPLV